MPVSYAKVACCKPEELGPRSGVDIVGATALTVVPAKPPHLKEAVAAFVMVAGDVGDMGQPLASGMRWIRREWLDVDGEGLCAPLDRLVGFRMAHTSDEPVELVYSVRKAG